MVDVDLDMVLLSDCGDGVDLLTEIFRGERYVEKTVNHGVVCGWLVVMRVKGGAMNGAAYVRWLPVDRESWGEV